MPAASLEHLELLTHTTLSKALEHEEASVIVCGTLAAVKARRIVSDDGPMPGRLKVYEHAERLPEAWELY